MIGKRTNGRSALQSMNKRILGLGLLAFALAACGGGGGGGGGDGGFPAPQPGANVTASGRITFDRVPFKTTLGAGLDFARPIEAPARNVVVEAVDSSTSAILSTSRTDASGNYSFTVPGNRTLFIRAKALMQSSGGGASWDFRVLNNTNANALYSLDGQPFNSGSSDISRNLHAASGFGTSLYTTTRPAAPFAILDTVYQAKELLLSANPALAMPPLSIYWSVTNRPATPFCPSTGNIASTAYQRSSSNECTPSSVSPGGIYVQGDFANGIGDTDEFDQSVVAHEFGHYIEDMIGRSDSIGGPHSSGNRLDMRVAMSEGWGNAFAGMVLNDPIYRDSISGTNADNIVNVESEADPNPGWFSESTVEQVIWDVFDTANESGDGVSLGFAPIFQTVSGPQRTTAALTSLYTFVTGLKSIAPAQAAAIDALLTQAPRNMVGTTDFAVGETNNGSQPIVLPIYKPLTINQLSQPVCSTAQFGSYNRLGNRQFLTFTLSAPMTVSITLNGTPSGAGSVAATDPDFNLYRQGSRVAFGDSQASGTEVRPNVALQSGTYVLEVYDFVYTSDTVTNSSTMRCMTVSITG